MAKKYEKVAKIFGPSTIKFSPIFIVGFGFFLLNVLTDHLVNSTRAEYFDGTISNKHDQGNVLWNIICCKNHFVLILLNNSQKYSKTMSNNQSHFLQPSNMSASPSGKQLANFPTLITSMRLNTISKWSNKSMWLKDLNMRSRTFWKRLTRFVFSF